MQLCAQAPLFNKAAWTKARQRFPKAAPIAQYVPMLQPAVAAVPEEGVRVVGGAATCGIVAAAAEKNVKKKKVKRGNGKRGKGKGTYTKRICPHCGRYMDKKVNHGEGKCEPKPAEQQ